ncbi:hypothetical protein NVP1170O_206 [Vibrio phage 1.170.O._10N.261.52.C3]|nr:hypothetical protein NVP1170O_206 [Vibrio phage 1.170.O._10N.261.52.C3]
MTIKHIKANAVTYTLEDDSRILIHVCNDVKIMGSGIAREIRNRVPSAYTNYTRSACRLGNVTYSDDYKIANMVSQHEYNGYKGNYRRGHRFLNYAALNECLNEISSYFYLQDSGITEVVLPFKMGADRAGGDWEIVMELVEWQLGGVFDITICEI